MPNDVRQRIYISGSGGDPFRFPISESFWASLPELIRVSSDRADLWLGAFEYECQERNFYIRQVTHHQAHKNVGIITLCANQYEIVWEVIWTKPRNGDMQVRISFSSDKSPSEPQLADLMSSIENRIVLRNQTKFHRQGQLEFEGRRWAGEIWLDRNLRLGAPSVQWEQARKEPNGNFDNGPRIILVDALMEAFGPYQISNEFEVLIDSLALFLTVLLGQFVNKPRQKLCWVLTPDGVSSTAAWTGYLELEASSAMPTKGVQKSVPLYEVSRPDLTPLSSEYPAGDEVALPSDSHELWASYCGLSPTNRRQFSQAAAKFQEALYLLTFRPTLSFSLLVAACEALKPREEKYDNNNHEYVVKELLGRAISKKMRLCFSNAGLLHEKSAQRIRNQHLHRGDWFGDELHLRLAAHSFDDPTFNEAARFMRRVTQAALIEWLRRAGFWRAAP
jgi:hypothetical protein